MYMKLKKILSAALRLVYRTEYPDSSRKRFVVLGIISKTIPCDVLPVIKENYQKTAARLKNINRPLRVLFLVNETAKWQYQSLYEAMDQAEDYDPLVVIVPTKKYKAPPVELKELYSLFEDQGIKAEYGYDVKRKTFLPLDTFSPDIVFYQQSWPLAPEQGILPISAHALCCYCSYSVVEDCVRNFGFVRALTCHFLPFQGADNQMLSQENQLDNGVAAGSPKLEYAAQVIARHVKQSGKPTVIYAPHHSFPTDAKSLRWATFQWSGPAMLRLAEKYSGFNWVLKPHPRFQHAVVHYGVMSERQIAAYYAEWEKHGRIVTGGNYYDLFAESDLMITDCGSFMWEYLLTRKPLIYLLRPDGAPRTWLEPRCYYPAGTESEADVLIDDLLIKRGDPKKEQREQMYQWHVPWFDGASGNILRTLSDMVKNPA